MASPKGEKINKNKKIDTKSVVKPKLNAGTPILTNCMIGMPVNITGAIKKVVKNIKKK